jgi:hypothetical protein
MKTTITLTVKITVEATEKMTKNYFLKEEVPLLQKYLSEYIEDTLVGKWQYAAKVVGVVVLVDKVLIELKDAFAVLDALRGSLTGEYDRDLIRLHKTGRTCSEQVYNEAYQMDQQP